MFLYDVNACVNVPNEGVSCPMLRFVPNEGVNPFTLSGLLRAPRASIGATAPRPRVFLMADDEDMEVEKDTGGDSKQRFVVKKWCVQCLLVALTAVLRGRKRRRAGGVHCLSARIATAA